MSSDNPPTNERLLKLELQVKRLVSDAESEKGTRKRASQENREAIEKVRTEFERFKTDTLLALAKNDFVRVSLAGLIGSLPAAIVLVWYLVSHHQP